MASGSCSTAARQSCSNGDKSLCAWAGEGRFRSRAERRLSSFTLAPLRRRGAENVLMNVVAGDAKKVRDTRHISRLWLMPASHPVGNGALCLSQRGSNARLFAGERINRSTELVHARTIGALFFRVNRGLSCRRRMA